MGSEEESSSEADPDEEAADGEFCFGGPHANECGTRDGSIGERGAGDRKARGLDSIDSDISDWSECERSTFGHRLGKANLDDNLTVGRDAFSGNAIGGDTHHTAGLFRPQTGSPSNKRLRRQWRGRSKLCTSLREQGLLQMWIKQKPRQAEEVASERGPLVVMQAMLR